MKFLKYLLVGIAALLLIVVLLVWLVIQGIQPLEDGAELANGNVIITADDCNWPIQCAAYLFRLRDGGFGLIDAGLDPEAKAIRAALARMGKSDDDIRAILFTHSHGDHTEGARAFPHAEIYLLERVNLTPDGAGQRPSPEGPDTVHGIAVTRRLSDGERLDLNGTTVEVFALPGHTADSAAFLAHGVLFFGDSAAASSVGTISSAPPIYSVDRERNQRELRALADRLRSRRNEIRHMAFGHQGPLAGIEPLLEWAAREE